MANNSRALICLIKDIPNPFEVTVSTSDSLYFLQDAIFEQRKNALRDVDAAHLVLWKLNEPVPAIPSRTLAERVSSLGELSQFAAKLHELAYTVMDVFPEQPPWDLLHIIVQKPVGRNKPASPKPLATMSARKGTVAALYNKLKTYHFIQVRGPPASGKSTLAQLLSRHIEALEPSTPLIWVDGWSDALTISNTWNKYLEKDKHWDENIASVFIFDEAQMTYRDTGLWNTLFKAIPDNPSFYHHHRVILFASYGSPTRIHTPCTQMIIQEPQMVTLVPIDHHDGLGAVGLCLTRPEFEEFVNLRRYSFDPACLDFIFRISSGHAGAMMDVINVISCDDSYQKITASQKLFTISDFFQHFTSHRLYAGLQDCTIFQRGLPGDDVLRTPSVAHVLRTALREKVIVDTMFPEAEESAALRQCFVHGWLHTDKVQVVSENYKITGYFFASPLHRLFMEWKLRPRSGQNPAIPIQAPSLLEFVIQVVERFSPLKLSYPHIVGPHCFQTSLGAQCDNEFYRCCYDLTTGSLMTLSEFGTADGRIDFYIPSKKWAVVLLRNGELLEQHNKQFFPTGQYGTTLDIDEYILLDFRKKIEVVQAHPDLASLFHVVFSDDCYKVAIIDSECRTVREFGLQTQS